jgi:hypothetical protein
MRLLRNRRGQIRVIEAFFASVLLLSSLSLIPFVQRSSGDNDLALSGRAFNVLVSLDGGGHLASLVDSEDWVSLRCEVASCVGVAVWFNLTVFDQDMHQLNDLPICSGCAVSDTVDVADYVCPSVSGEYRVYVLRLQLAVVN